MGTHPFAPVASSYNTELISHGPIFNVSDGFIGAWSQMGVGGMGATLLIFLPTTNFLICVHLNV